MKIIAVADMFLDQYQGGAELTFESILESNNLNFQIEKINCKNLTKNFAEENKNNFWIFGNFASLDRNLMLYFVKSDIKYAVMEYDYKYCQYRSPEKHKAVTGEECDCASKRVGKEVALFLFKSSILCWMSASQKAHYESIFPPLANKDNSFVLSSTFSERDDRFMTALNSLQSKKNNDYIILDSNSWIKGKDKCIAYAEDNNLDYKLVSGLRRHEFLRLLSESKGLIFLPLGKDTCPRLVIEAKILGCDIKINDNVEHNNEIWFQKNSDSVLQYLRQQKLNFWSIAREVVGA